MLCDRCQCSALRNAVKECGVTEMSETLSDRFRDVMAGVATPVTVVTAMAQGDPRGTTVSAFASLSMTPPMIMVALDRSSALLNVLRSSPTFGVNVLGRHQATAALAFARKGGSEKFADIAWTLDHDLPRLVGAPGWLACDVDTFVDGGDHLVLLGRVIAAELRTGEPLTYHGRTFGTHKPAPKVDVAAPADWDDDELLMRYFYGVG
jgi:flavin reductase (DIM6/NTAB) family NADH-FMN oxidoreductase RutF